MDRLCDRNKHWLTPTPSLSALDVPFTDLNIEVNRASMGRGEDSAASVRFSRAALLNVRVDDTKFGC